MQKDTRNEKVIVGIENLADFMERKQNNFTRIICTGNPRRSLSSKRMGSSVPHNYSIDRTNRFTVVPKSY